MSEEAAERVAFNFAEASDLAVLGLRAERKGEEGDVDGRRSDLSEMEELPDMERELDKTSG